MSHYLFDLPWDGKDSKEANEIKQGLKSKEEIAHYLIDEALSDLDRAAMFISSASSHPLQRLSVINGLPALLTSYSITAFDVVFPQLQVSLITARVVVCLCACVRVCLCTESIANDGCRVSEAFC